jgi:hypothetical protein
MFGIQVFEGPFEIMEYGTWKEHGKMAYNITNLATL